jgi:hypothetical protein
MRKLLLLFRDALLALVIALAMLAVLEVLLRVLYAEPAAAPAEPPATDIAFEAHPDYLVGLKPNLHDRRFVRPTTEGEVVTHWSTNSASFRGEREFGEKSRLRIMVYGDSNIFARFSDEGQTFAVRLERALAAATGHEVEAINAGVPGFGPDQSLLRMEGEFAHWRPDIIVFHVFADNDFGDLIRNRLFELSTDGALLRRPVTAPDPCLLRPADCAPPLSLGARAQDWASSLFITRAAFKVLSLAGVERRPASPSPQQEIQSWLEMNAAEYAAYRNPQATAFSQFVDHYDADLALEPLSDAAATKRALMSAVLAAAHEFANERGARFLLLIEPSSYDLTENIVPNHTHFAEFRDYAPRNLTSTLETIAEDLSIDYINLFDAFTQAGASTLYFMGPDNHWNDAGQAVAAAIVASRLEEVEPSVALDPP